MAQVKLSRKYQIVVPKEIRKKMNLESGENIAIYSIDAKRAIIVKQSNNPVAALEGLGSEIWRKLGGGQKYLKEERKSWHR